MSGMSKSRRWTQGQWSCLSVKLGNDGGDAVRRSFIAQPRRKLDRLLMALFEGDLHV